MASNEAKFTVDVQTKGLKAAKKDVDDLGSSARKASGSYNETNKAAGGFYNTQAKGIIGTANSTKSFSKLAETMNGSSGIVGAYATLAANIFAVTAAFNALRGAAQVQQVQNGLEAMGSRMGRTLSVAAENVREISGYTLSAEQAMRSTAQIASSGLGTKAIEDLTKVARDASFALGRNMTDSMDRLSRGVVKLEPELLDELGLMTKIGESTAKYANQLGKSETQLSNFEKRQGFLNAIVTEGTTKFGGLADSAGNTRNFDRLAATFSDLTTNIFKFINEGALPLAGIFSSKGVLLGGMLLFASTISRQLLPGLSNLSIKTAESAKALTQVAKANIQAVPTSKFEPKGLRSLRSDIQNDKATIASYDTALIGIQQRQEKLNKEIEAGETRKRRLSEQAISKRREEIETLSDQASVIRSTRQLEQQAEAKTLAANAIVAAGEKKLLTSKKLLVLAVREYSASITTATVATGRFAMLAPAITRVRVAFFAAATGARVLGAAITSTLGWIGLIVTGVTLLVEALTWLKKKIMGSEWEKFNEALEEQSDILENLNKVRENAIRVAGSEVSLGERQNQVYSATANAIAENIEAYEKVKAAQNDYFKGSSTVRVGDTAEYRTLEYLRSSGLPGLRDEVEKALGKRGLQGKLDDVDAKLTKKELESVSEVLTKDLRTGFVTVGFHIKDFNDATKEASQAIADFNRNMIPNTPYDTVVKQLDNVTNSMSNIINTAAGNKDYSSIIAGQLTNAGDAITGFFSVGLQKDIKEFNTLDLQIQALGDKATKNQIAQKKALADSIALRAEELYTVQEIFLTAQNLARQTQSQIALEQTRLEKLNSYTALTASSIKQRREAENRILQLQANQIKSQVNIIKLQIESQKQQLAIAEAAILTDETYGSILSTLQSIGDQQGSNFMGEVNRRIAALSAEKNSTNDSGRRAEIDKEVVALQEAAKKYGDIRAIQIKIRDAQSAITASSAEMAAILGRQTSAAVINAEGLATAAQTSSQNGQKQLEINSELLRQDQQRLEIERLREGRTKNLASELRAILDQSRLLGVQQKAQIRNEALANVAQLQFEQTKAAGNKEEVAAYEKRIGLEIESARLKMDAIDLQTQQNILEKVSFDTQKEGLEMQISALDYMEKTISAQSDLLSKQREGAALDREIARRRRGVRSNDDTQKVDAIIEAKAELDLARQEADMRKSIIRLEYALLEAKRQQTIFDMEAQKAALLAAGANSNLISQLDATLTNLRNAAGTVADAQAAAERAVDQNILNLGKKLEILGLNESRSTSQGDLVSSFINARKAQKSAVSAGQDAQNNLPPSVIQTYIAPITQPIVQSNSNLSLATIDNTAALKGLTEEAKKLSISMPSSNKTLNDFAKMATDNGFRVSEIGARSGHRGRGHREGRAFDMNIGGGNTEANNTAMRRRMDAMAQEFVKQGLVVLWNGQRMTSAGTSAIRSGQDQHRDHMHVEIPAGGIKQVAMQVQTAVVETIQPAAKAIVTTADTATAAVKNAENDNRPIVVAGQRKAPAEQRMPMDIGTLTGVFERLTSQGDFNMLEVFQNMADALGPQGTIIPQIIQGVSAIGYSIDNLMTKLNNPDASFSEKFTAGAAVAQNALATIQGVLQAASDARVAGIEREIAAEQKRDGKSAESVAKIKALEAKKDAIMKKQFNTNKKLMMAQAVIATAAGIAQALGSMPPPASFIMAGIIGAMGAAQLAIIASTQYQSSASSNFDQKTMPDTLSIGKRGDGINVARNNSNIGGELGYLRGSQGTGSNSGNYALANPPGSAYGGPLPRGYGNSAFVVGEKGPEVIEPMIPMTVRSNSQGMDGSVPQMVNFNVTAFDGQSVQEMLSERRGDIIDMLREAANANGSRFLEDVNTSHYKKAGAGRGRRI